jgi:hypothetical protein
MKYFKVLIWLFFFVLGLACCCLADTANPNLCFPFEGANICIPLANTSAVYLYDALNKKSLVGAESPIVIYKASELTIGAVTTTSGAGTPFFGADYLVPNVPVLQAISGVRLGGFGGRDFRDGVWTLGAKASVLLW